VAITIEIPSALRLHSRGSAVVTLDTHGRSCESIGAALSALESQYPGVLDRVVTEEGDLRPHVNVFVDGENSRFADGLSTPIRDPATITILAAISGG
jgi:sulfur-carrier protein